MNLMIKMFSILMIKVDIENSELKNKMYSPSKRNVPQRKCNN